MCPVIAPARSRQVVLHIGMPKTGSSSIQKAMASHPELLAERGVVYPEWARRGTAHHPLHWALARTNLSGARNAGLDPDSVHRGLVDALETPSDRVVFSSEAIWTGPAPVLDAVAEVAAACGREVVVLVYLRRQAEQAESWYRQAVKLMGHDKPFDQYIEGRGRDNARALEAIQEHARVEPMVRIFERPRLVGGDAVTDFMSVLELPEVDPPSANPSLDPELTELKRRLNPGFVDQPTSARVGAAMANWSKERRRAGLVEEGSLFTESGYHRFQARFASSNRMVAEALGLPRLFEDPPPSRFLGTGRGDIDVVALLASFSERFPALAESVAEARRRVDGR